MADPTSDDTGPNTPGQTPREPTPREAEVADNMGVSATDPHTSPANPENRISVGRRAADAENAEQIVQNVPGALMPARPGHRATKTARRRPGKQQAEVGSTGHSWDGIEEYDNPLPRWWLWTFYATIIWALGYVVAYPAIPLVNRATEGLLGRTTRNEVAAEIQRFDEANAPIQARLTSVELAAIRDDPELMNYAGNAGASVFRTYCAQCHGSGAAGNPGYPNLLDNDWLWGGTIEDIHLTLLHGIRSPDDPDTRYSEMPKFGLDGLLDDTQIAQVTQYVLSLSDQPHDAAAAQAGQTIFAEQCTACHMEDGTGDRAQGAPNLTDAVWLYNRDGQADAAVIQRIIHDGPFGVMPAWSERLSEADIRAVATYVHGLGGGE